MVRQFLRRLFARPAEQPQREPQTLDLSARVWGLNYSINAVLDSARLRCAIWSPRLPEVGDYLLLANPGSEDGKTRYRVDSVERCFNPEDMAFVELTFAPRPRRETPDT